MASSTVENVVRSNAGGTAIRAPCHSTTRPIAGGTGGALAVTRTTRANRTHFLTACAAGRGSVTGVGGAGRALRRRYDQFQSCWAENGCPVVNSFAVNPLARQADTRSLQTFSFAMPRKLPQPSPRRETGSMHRIPISRSRVTRSGPASGSSTAFRPIRIRCTCSRALWKRTARLPWPSRNVTPRSGSASSIQRVSLARQSASRFLGSPETKSDDGRVGGARSTNSRSVSIKKDGRPSRSHDRPLRERRSFARKNMEILYLVPALSSASA